MEIKKPIAKEPVLPFSVRSPAATFLGSEHKREIYDHFEKHAPEHKQWRRKAAFFPFWGYPLSAICNPTRQTHLGPRVRHRRDARWSGAKLRGRHRFNSKP